MFNFKMNGSERDDLKKRSRENRAAQIAAVEERKKAGQWEHGILKLSAF